LLLTLPFGLYAGWTTCATFVNIAEVAPQLGFERFGLSVPLFGAASIAVATAAAAFVLLRTRGALVYALTVAWALIAILVASQTRGYDQIIVYAASAALALVLLIASSLKLTRHAA
ncbi:MAG: hypothetical protein K2X34_10395, partial [Hyphomonadaceae bacterium]|nr:hypothetical protein [Hyphomonadaceae bacterium]